MRFLEALLGLNALWQLETAIAVVTRLTLLFALGQLLALLVPARDAGRREALFLLPLVFAMLLPVVSGVVPDLTLSYTLPTALNHVDNPVAGGGLREALARIVLGVDEPGFFVREASAARQPGPLGWIVWAWMAGALALSARWMAGIQRLNQIATTSRLAPSRVHTALANALTFLPPCPSPAVRISNRFDVPVVFGVRRPIILLPEHCLGWTDRELEIALVHELTHLRRRDPMRELIAACATALAWFHPLVWWFATRRRRLAELACDAAVVSSGVEPSAYANLLLRAASPAGHTTLPALSFSTSDELDARIRFVMVNARTGASRLPQTVTAVLFVAYVAIAGLAPRSVAGHASQSGTCRIAATPAIPL